MTELAYLFAALAVLTGTVITISVWAPRRLPIKVAALAGGAMMLPVGYLAFAHLLSMPKPVGLEWYRQHAEDATVLGSSMREGENIYLWLQFDDAAEPRSYVIPWRRDLAEQLQKAKRQADAEGGQLRVRRPFEPSLDDRQPKFYAMPQPAPPPKHAGRQQPTPALTFEQAMREQEI